MVTTSPLYILTGLNHAKYVGSYIDLLHTLDGFLGTTWLRAKVNGSIVTAGNLNASMMLISEPCSPYKAMSVLARDDYGLDMWFRAMLRKHYVRKPLLSHLEFWWQDAKDADPYMSMFDILVEDINEALERYNSHIDNARYKIKAREIHKYVKKEIENQLPDKLLWKKRVEIDESWLRSTILLSTKDTTTVSTACSISDIQQPDLAMTFHSLAGYCETISTPELLMPSTLCAQMYSNIVQHPHQTAAAKGPLPSFRSSTKSATLLRYLPSIDCFSSVVLVFPGGFVSTELKVSLLRWSANAAAISLPLPPRTAVFVADVAILGWTVSGMR